MPEGVSANFVSDTQILNFPTGTVLTKNFYYNNVLPNNETKIIETRLMIKKDSGWIFANYVWNDEQTEAYLDNDGSFIAIEWNQDGEIKNTNYRIPSEAECLTCHKLSNSPLPIGIKPQNINRNFNYSTGNMNQLEKMVDMGYLDNINTGSINTVVDWTDQTKSLDLRTRSYLDINCAHCHSENTHCSYRAIRLAFNDTYDETNRGECVIPDEAINPAMTHIVSPGRPERSMMAYRIGATDESIRMPLIGRSIVHEDGNQLIEEWIDSLTTICN